MLRKPGPGNSKYLVFKLSSYAFLLFYSLLKVDTAQFVKVMMIGQPKYIFTENTYTCPQL